MTAPKPADAQGWFLAVRQDWLDRLKEEVVEPKLPIVDPVGSVGGVGSEKVQYVPIAFRMLVFVLSEAKSWSIVQLRLAGTSICADVAPPFTTTVDCVPPTVYLNVALSVESPTTATWT